MTTPLHRDIDAQIAQILPELPENIRAHATHAVIRVIAFDTNPFTTQAYEASIRNLHISTEVVEEQLDAVSAHERLKIIKLVPDVLARLLPIANDPNRDANKHARSVELTELGQAHMIWRSATTAVIYASMQSRLSIPSFGGHPAAQYPKGIFR
jgi:hypothetical protein